MGGNCGEGGSCPSRICGARPLDARYTTDPLAGNYVTVRMEDATDDRLSIIGVHLPDYTGPLTAADFGLE